MRLDEPDGIRRLARLFKITHERAAQLGQTRRGKLEVRAFRLCPSSRPAATSHSMISMKLRLPGLLKAARSVRLAPAKSPSFVCSRAYWSSVAQFRANRSPRLACA